MKVTLSWLKRFLETDADVTKISDALNAIGIEVEHIIDRSKDYASFFVGEIQEITKHPQADKLNCCKVNDGHKLIDIITAAENVRENLKVVVAPVGSVIPTNNMKIEERKLRGMPSYGMLCSGAELGISSDNEGIMELPDNVKVGSKITDIFPELQEKVIEVSLTPNRADCLGVYGIARDLAAYGIGKLKPLAHKDIKSSQKKTIKIRVENNKDCPLFIGRYFSNIKNQESPDWLKSLLISIGDNPKSALVDITNYISYSFGRPLHVYDADKIKGEIIIRNARDGERFVSLKAEEYKLSKEDLVVADQSSVLGLAGIIGGDDSKCEINSKNIYLEAGVFDPIKVTKSARRLNINTEAKHIFERGVDHNFTINGAIIASNLIQEICGGEASDLEIVGHTEKKSAEIKFDLARVKSLSGVTIDQGKMIQILADLGFSMTEKQKGSVIEVSIPSWRHDISCEEDLIEEVLRIYGYDQIPTKTLPASDKINKLPLLDQKLYSARSLLASQGCHELVTFSFMSSKIAEKFGFIREDLFVKNPISADLDILRKSILPNILSAIQKNNLRSLNNLSFFEIGPIFNSGAIGDQSKSITGVRSGSTSRENIYGDSREYDFFDAKRDVLDLLQIWGVSEDKIQICKEEIPAYFHPAKSAVLKLNNKVIAHLGEIHPTILEFMKIKTKVVAFELLIDSLPLQDRKRDIFISNYQQVSRDFAFVVDKEIEAGSLVKAIKSSDTKFITNVHIFDIYYGEEIGKNSKSIAMNVTLQAKDRTLTNDDISLISDKIIKSVKNETSGKLREV
jgi:phenylalanyl-tRNA synthetase beta chain